MKPLLEITTIPVSIEIHMTKGTYEQTDPAKSAPKMKMHIDKGGYEIKAEPAQLKIDTYRSMASVGMGSMNDSDLIKTITDKAYKISYEGTASIVEEGNMLERGMTSAEVASQKMRSGFTIETVMDFLPKEGPDITYQEGKLSINYTMDEVDIDWENLIRQPVKFIPGKIEIQVEQMPKIQIDYVGEPLYFPRSSNPNYEPTFSEKA